MNCSIIHKKNNFFFSKSVRISIVSQIKSLKSDDSLFALLKTKCITFLGVIANIKFVFPLFFVSLKI